MTTHLPSDVENDLARIRAWEPAAADRLEATLARILQAADALAWARGRLAELAHRPSEPALLQAVVDEAVQLTGVPHAWALTWTRRAGTIRFEALAGSARTADGDLVTPDAVSRSMLGYVVDEGRPVWSDDVGSDARFLAAESVQAMGLRSVGCLPLGRRGVLYLHDPDGPGRFAQATRARLSALCAMAAELLPDPSAPARPPPEPLPGLVGDTPPMHDLYDSVRAFAPMPWPVLLLGDTGTGKEAVARAIHGLSGRRGAFVAVNCGAITDTLAESTLFGHVRGAFTGADRPRQGLVELAQGGSLFLDEVGELAPTIQTQLLRLLQEGTYRRLGEEVERRFDGRVIAATHRAIELGSAFRADLFHRLSACVIRVPALRERSADIPGLAEHLLQRVLAEVPAASGLRLAVDAEAALRARPWPGNVRELQNVIKSAVARCLAMGDDHVRAVHLAPSPAVRSSSEGAWPADLQLATERFQKARVREALVAHEGNKTLAAEHLGVTRQWLHKLIARWDDEGPW